MRVPAALCLMAMLASGTAYSQNVSDNHMTTYTLPTYKGSDLEMRYSPERTVFGLWSPMAQSVTLRIYEQGLGGAPLQTLQMSASPEQGIWRMEVPGDLKGKFYTFAITVNGKELAETPGIWAKAVGVNGKRGAVVDMRDTNPAGWAQDARPVLKAPTDAVIYEMHHRDMSAHISSGINHRGKFLAWTEQGTKTPGGKSTGIDHLKELGVTHVHILPSYDFGSIDETKLEINKYNWGYDPVNYNAPEGSYSTDPYNPEARIREFKQMVQSFHQAGIRVIMDVVYNHTYIGKGSNFDLTAPGYFYRMRRDGSFSDASGCGNETASEKEMMRRYIIESVKYWAQEYHVDGFRFDLMGIHDIETMNQLTDELHKIDPSIIVYGEGWTASSSPLPAEQRALKGNARKLKDVAVFSDDLRDALKGHYTQEAGKGFASGKEGMEESIKFGVVAAGQHPEVDYSQVNYSKAPYTNKPSQVINYVSCHDDLNLVDKLKKSNPHASEAELIKRHKLAQTAVFTSQGIPFLFSGEEVFRDKKGVHNTYESPDSINAIDWTLKDKHSELFEFYKQLIALRKAHPAFRMQTAEQVQQHLSFLSHTPAGMVAYQLDGQAVGDSWQDVIVVLNGNETEQEIALPHGKWQVAMREGEIDLQGMGKAKGKVKVAANTALILFR